MLPDHKYALPSGTRLRHYVIERLLGHGGFGLTYLAEDSHLSRKVAIKELLPIDFAVREKDGTTVVPRSQSDELSFEWARDRFMEEGRTLAALHHPSILPVHDIFEEHGTAYLVTGFIEGDSLAVWLRNFGPPPEADLRSITMSLLEALEVVHGRGYLHRDVKPENILMERHSRRPILIDFGSARVATGERTSNLTAVLSKGYAPFEQYQNKGRQGPFTDLYALGAVLYRAITGAVPEDAADRWEEDKMQPLTVRRPSGYSPEFLATVDKALRLRREDRWQKCEEWKAALNAPKKDEKPKPRPAPEKSKAGQVIVTLALLILAGAAVKHWTPKPVDIGGLKVPTPTPFPFPFPVQTVAPFRMPAWISTPTPSSPASPSGTPRFPPFIGYPGFTLATPGAAPTPSRTITPAPRAILSTPRTVSPTPYASPPSLKTEITNTFPWLPSVLPTPTPTVSGRVPATATYDHPFVNSLGMKFIPAPWTKALFCIWDTRVKDYAEYARVNKVDASWTQQQEDGAPVSREPEYPVVGVNWDDAEGFCKWLTEKERAEGKLTKEARYRLPTDREWSAAAVGFAFYIGKPEMYSWGPNYPPAKLWVGNYADAAYHARFPKEPWLTSYTDGFTTTSPVGSFPENIVGLYDMGGNVAQWCGDKTGNGSHVDVALRGSSWRQFNNADLRLDAKQRVARSYRSNTVGFRCVLEYAPLTPADVILLPPAF